MDAPSYRGDQLSISYQLLYHIMTLLKSCTDKAFEIVIDITQATQLNEPDVSLSLMPMYVYVVEYIQMYVHTYVHVHG